MLSFFIQIFRDLIIRFLPFKIHRDYRFAFLIHSRDIDDIYRKFSFAVNLPKSVVRYYCRHFWPFIVSKITGLKSGDGKEIPGYIIGVPMTARQMVENRKSAVKKIIKACRLAEKLGVRIIGLGALTSSMSGGGSFLVNKIKAGITTGHALTAYIIIRYVLDFVDIIGLNKKDDSVAVIGAAGSIGSTCSILLAKEGISKILLVDLERKNEKLKELILSLKKINPEMKVSVSHRVGDIVNSPLIITATNAPENLIKSEDLRPGAIVIDDAQPSDVSQEVIENRKDVLIVEGGVIKTPGVNSNFNFGLANKDDNYSCLGEVSCLATIYWKGNYNVGRTDLKKVSEIGRIANKLNFQRGDFQNSGKVYSPQDIEEVKNIIKKNVQS